MSTIALSTKPTPDTVDSPPKKRSFWRPSLCSSCRQIQLRICLRLRPKIPRLLPPLETWKINDCDCCQLFFYGLTTDQRDARTFHPAFIQIYSGALWKTDDFFTRRLLSTKTIGWNFGTSVRLTARTPSGSMLDHEIYSSKRTLPAKLVSPFISTTVVQMWLEKSGVTQETGSVRDAILSHVNHEMSGLTVIDCRSDPLTLVPLPTKEHYVTLSYVWGPTQTAEEPIKDSRLPLSLPPTIADSITVCNTLGFRFLWIDRYCIPQTNEQVKSELIARMDKIYNCSSLTLIACVGNGPQHGLTGISRPRAITPRIRGFQIVPSTQDVKYSVWGSRGWTFQEALLSRRQLYFTDRQLIFQGVDSVESELTAGSKVKFDTSLDPIFPSGSFLNDSPQRRILECIIEYSGRTLARPETDRLIALYGIFSAFENTGVGHLWGLPFAHNSQDNGLSLATSLCWNRSRPTSELSARYSEFPTWSWASCPHQAEYVYVETSGLSKPHIEVEGVELLTGKIIPFEEHRSRCHSMSHNPQHLSEFIHIVAHHTTPLSIRVSYWLYSLTSLEVDVLLSNGQTSVNELYIYLDSLVLPLTSIDVLVAVHLDLNQNFQLLLLRERGDYWERIGMCVERWGDFSDWHMEPRKFRLG